MQRGETLVLLGRSGAGKTTALKLINRLLDATEGLDAHRRTVLATEMGPRSRSGGVSGT